MARATNITGKTLLRALAGGACLAMLVACGAGETPVATRTAPTFVSLNPCLDAILVEVAEPDQILALSHYSRDPSSSSIDADRARQFGVTGGTVEEVLALDPDIVLASAFIAPSARTALESMGIEVETFGSPVSVAQSIGQIRDLSTLTGGEEKAERLIDRIENALAAPAAQPPISTLMWQPGQIVPGEATLVSELLRRGGFISHSAARGLGQADYVALETLLADPPELLLVAGSSAGQSHPMLGTMRATHVEMIDPGLLYCGGPTIIALRERLDQVRETIEHRNAVPIHGPRQARSEGDRR